MQEVIARQQEELEAFIDRFGKAREPRASAQM
mgnify:CR=1 FL=1